MHALPPEVHELITRHLDLPALHALSETHRWARDATAAHRARLDTPFARAFRAIKSSTIAHLTPDLLDRDLPCGVHVTTGTCTSELTGGFRTRFTYRRKDDKPVVSRTFLALLENDETKHVVHIDVWFSIGHDPDVAEVLPDPRAVVKRARLVILRPDSDFGFTLWLSKFHVCDTNGAEIGTPTIRREYWGIDEIDKDIVREVLAELPRWYPHVTPRDWPVVV